MERNRSWADDQAEEVLKRKQESYVCEGMWTPSGSLHIGNARAELFTPYAVRHALEMKGAKTRQNFIVDDFDAVRKIPSGLGIKPAEHGDYLGFSCYKAPSPLPGFKNWADAFVSEIRAAIESYGVELNIQSAYEQYKQGRLNDVIIKSIEKAPEIVKVWNRVAGAEKSTDFIPVQVVCEGCGRIHFTQATAWDGKKASYRCTRCKHAGSVSPLNGNAKLHWRVHWAAFWLINKVDFESGGKDHFSKGGSVDVGHAIMREVFDTEPPVQTMTEFIQFKGRKMSGSVGNVVGLSEWLKIASPESFRYLNFSYRPGKAIELDLSAHTFIRVVEQFERAGRIYFGDETAQSDKLTKKIKRNYELACIGGVPKTRPVQVPFSFAVLLGQLFDPEKEWARLEQAMKDTGHVPADLDKEDAESLKRTLLRARYWARTYAPEEDRLSFSKTTDKAFYAGLGANVKEVLAEIALAVEKARNAETLQEEIAGLARKDADPKRVFQAFYTLLLGRSAGPRAGSLALALGKKKVAARLRGE